jgi:predicted PurR-regulated permease PerM
MIYLGIKLTISQLTVFLDNIPLLKDQAVTNFDSIVEDLARVLNLDADVLRDRFLTGVTESQGLANTVLNATTGTIIKLGLIPVYMFFLLLFRDRFHNFILMLTDEDLKERMDHIMDEIRLVSKQYIGGVFVVVSILCVLNSLGLFIIGLKYSILLGVLSAVMNFIPYFGTLIGAAIPMAYTLVSPHPEHFIKVAILFVIIQFLENNILTPNITGNQVRLNPFITIISIVIGGMIWGIPGMFLSVPVMGVIYVICKNVPKLEPWAYILGADDDEKTQSIFKKLIYKVISKRK